MHFVNIYITNFKLYRNIRFKYYLAVKYFFKSIYTFYYLYLLILYFVDLSVHSRVHLKSVGLYANLRVGQFVSKLSENAVKYSTYIVIILDVLFNYLNFPMTSRWPDARSRFHMLKSTVWWFSITKTFLYYFECALCQTYLY